MTSKIRWSLPDGVDELLPPKALQVETLRRSLVDKYIDSGYEFIIPPLLELSETIGGEAHDEIKSHAFSFKDNLTGKNLSIRPDISEQASRIDAYRIQSDETVRLCYAGEVVKSKSSKVLRSRTTIQVGAEIFGDPSKEAELESINLMLSSLAIAGIENTTLSLGHAGFTALVLAPFKDLGEEIFLNIESALYKKSKSDLDNIIPDSHVSKGSLLTLCDMYGKKDIIKKAKEEFSHIENSNDCLDHLEAIVEEIEEKQEMNLHIDLGEIQGFKYHNGIVFSAYSNSAGYVLAKGGRYDGLRKSSDQDRPAVGFDLDLIAVSNL
ncbi:ATP phosphoribosyltransferase regulatory subunit [Gammaproteobacteria bacterium]|nr:ATP phosphoribosyltransferase regulatory subunit [Gammaproteobacteria bacterium]MDC0546041.1 ATP phosphoribosyltransferase regulatory subunit [Gammaproteobacteria bacterium]MDC1251342.1 ATP phosphoribosyltransferase regulatory subunit [Gammaproteobacteria bacterium]